MRIQPLHNATVTLCRTLRRCAGGLIAACIVLCPISTHATLVFQGSQTNLSDQIQTSDTGQHLFGASASKTTTAVSMHATFGWNDNIWPADRFAPIRITLRSDKALGSTLVLRYKQDATQYAQLMLPASTTPGKPTSFEFVASVPYNCETISATLYDDKDRRIATTRWSNTQQPRTKSMPTPVTDQTIVVIADQADKGRLVGALANADRQMMLLQPESSNSWNLVMLANQKLEEMPRNWAAYEGVAVVVINASAAGQLHPDSLRALQLWCEQGGTLLLIADTPGEHLPPWFDPALGANPVVAAPLQRVSISSSMADFMPIDFIPSDEQDQELLDLISPKYQPNHQPYTPFRSVVNARPIELTTMGRHHNWQPIFLANPTTPLGARGPYGLGTMIVLGTNVQNLASVASPEITELLWKYLLRNDVIKRMNRKQPDRVWMYFDSSGGDTYEQNALTNAFENLSNISFPAGTVFVAIALGTFLLALGVGPFNAIILKHYHKQHLAWAATLGWIALASAPAWLAPLVLQTGKTMLARTSVEDILMPIDSSAVPLRWRSVTTALYPNKSGPIALDADPRGLWRGVSPMSSFSSNNPSMTMVLPALRVTEPGWQQVGVVPHELTQRVRSLHTAFDMEPNTLPLTMTIAAPASHVDQSPLETVASWKMTLQGLDENTTVSYAFLQIAQGSYAVQLEHLHDDQWHIALASENPLIDSDTRVLLHPFNQNKYMDMNNLINLPGAWQRTAAAQQRVASGKWAQLHLYVESTQPDIVISQDNAAYRTLHLIRIQCPIITESAEDIQQDAAGETWP